MQKDPLVSIIVLSYNGSRFLEACIDSILCQTYPRHRYEIIVADSASQDNSLSLLKAKYSREIRLIEFKVNHGFARGNNIAARHAKGQLLVFLNQDTVVDEEWLSELVKAINRGNHAVYQSNMLLPRNREFRKISCFEPLENVYYYDITKYGYADQIIRPCDNNIIETTFLSGASFIIKRSLIEQLGYLFDDTLGSYNEDMDLGFRLRTNGHKIGVVSSSIVYHFGSFSFKVSKYNIWKNLVLVRNRMLVHYKALKGPDFIRLLPYLMMSQSHKVFKRSTQCGNSETKSLILASCAVPLTIIGFSWFLLFAVKDDRRIGNPRYRCNAGLTGP